MAKTIRVDVRKRFRWGEYDGDGHTIVQPVLVNWFPPLTEDQVMANAAAIAAGEPQPYPNPNLIDVEIRVA